MELIQLYMKKHYDSAVTAAVDYLSYKERTEQQVRIKLREYGFDEKDIDEAIAELADSLLLDDSDYAHCFVQSKLAQKPQSLRSLRSKMKSRKLPDCIIEQELLALPENSDYENAYAESLTFFRRMNPTEGDADIKKLREKLMRRLINHGYCYDDVKSAVRQAEYDFFHPEQE